MAHPWMGELDHNNKSGNDKKTCPYFQELSDIFGMTPAVKPVALCSNRAGTSGADLTIASSSSQSWESVASPIAAEGSSSNTELTPRKERRRSRAKRALQSKESRIDLFKEYQQKQREKREGEKFQGNTPGKNAKIWQVVGAVWKEHFQIHFQIRHKWNSALQIINHAEFFDLFISF